MFAVSVSTSDFSPAVGEPKTTETPFTESIELARQSPTQLRPAQPRENLAPSEPSMFNRLFSGAGYVFNTVVDFISGNRLPVREVTPNPTPMVIRTLPSQTRTTQEQYDRATELDKSRRKQSERLRNLQRTAPKQSTQLPPNRTSFREAIDNANRVTCRVARSTTPPYPSIEFDISPTVMQDLINSKLTQAQINEGVEASKVERLRQQKSLGKAHIGDANKAACPVAGALPCKSTTSIGFVPFDVRVSLYRAGFTPQDIEDGLI